jgi:hypothetical protein
MRANVRINKFGVTVFLMVSHTQSLEGVTSLQVDGLHTPFFDVENCSLIECVSALKELQIGFNLSDIFVTSDKDRSFRVWCFCHLKYNDYLRMQLILLDKKLLDYNFFWWTVKQGKSTLRTNSKQGRPFQKVVAFLPSFSVPFPKTCERVLYDTGIQKRGLTVFLGEGGKIIYD